MARQDSARSEESRRKAEGRFDKRKNEAAIAQADWQRDQQAVAAKTERLRALRLAKEEADRIALAAAPPPVKKKPVPRKKKVVAEPAPAA